MQWLATIKSKGTCAGRSGIRRCARSSLPDYPIGAKRVLFNDDYYPTLNRANVRLLTDGIERIEADGRAHAGRRAARGRRRHLRDRLPGHRFPRADGRSPARGGRDLRDEWKHGRPRVPRRHGERLPEPVHAVRAEHQPRPQQHPGDDRGAGGLRHRRHPPDGRPRPAAARREARRDGRIQPLRCSATSRSRCGPPTSRAGTSSPTAPSPTTGRTARSATAGCCSAADLAAYDMPADHLCLYATHEFRPQSRAFCCEASNENCLEFGVQCSIMPAKPR